MGWGCEGRSESGTLVCESMPSMKYSLLTAIMKILGSVQFYLNHPNYKLSSDNLSSLHWLRANFVEFFFNVNK